VSGDPSQASKKKVDDPENLSLKRILTQCSEEIILELRDEEFESGKELWDFFVSKFERTSSVKKLSVLFEWFHLKMDGKASDYLKSMIRDLKLTQCNVHQELIKLRFLDGLPESICGPISVNGLNGERYFIIFIDDYSKYIRVYPIKVRVRLVKL